MSDLEKMMKEKKPRPLAVEPFVPQTVCACHDIDCVGSCGYAGPNPDVPEMPIHHAPEGQEGAEPPRRLEVAGINSPAAAHGDLGAWEAAQ